MKGKKAPGSKRLKIKNMGKVSSQWLNDIGVYTLDDLRAMGAVEAYHRITLRGYHTSLNLLYGLWGALENMRWDMIPAEIKAQLRREAGV